MRGVALLFVSIVLSTLAMLSVGGRGVGVRKGDLESVVDRRCFFLQKGVWRPVVRLNG